MAGRRVATHLLQSLTANENVIQYPCIFIANPLALVADPLELFRRFVVNNCLSADREVPVGGKKSDQKNLLICGNIK